MYDNITHMYKMYTNQDLYESLVDEQSNESLVDKSDEEKPLEENVDEQSEDEPLKNEQSDQDEDYDFECHDHKNHNKLLRYGKDDDSHGVHYGMCIYCLMENRIEHWDMGWGEQWVRAAYVVKYGFQDKLDNIEYDTSNLCSSDYHIQQLIDIYKIGRNLAKTKIKSTKSKTKK